MAQGDSVAMKPSASTSSTSSYGDLKPYVERMNDLGPWANLFGVLTFVFSLLAAGRWLYKRFRQRTAPETISAWCRARLGAGVDEIAAKCRKRIKIAVVDDQPQDIASGHLIALSYKVSIFQRIALADVDQLRDYDVVILDITNVVVEDPAKGGLHVIRQLKSGVHQPIVIAVSGKRYDPSVTEFFKLADAQLKKPVSAQELSGTIDQLLKPNFTIGGIAKLLDKEIEGNGFTPLSEIKALNGRIVRAFKTNATLKAKSVLDDMDRTNRVNALIAKFIELRAIDGHH